MWVLQISTIAYSLKCIFPLRRPSLAETVIIYKPVLEWGISENNFLADPSLTPGNTADHGTPMSAGLMWDHCL